MSPLITSAEVTHIILGYAKDSICKSILTDQQTVSAQRFADQL